MDRVHRYHMGLPQPAVRTRIARWMLRRLLRNSSRPTLDEQIEFLWKCAIQAHREAEDHKAIPHHAETVEYWQRKAVFFQAACDSLQQHKP